MRRVAFVVAAVAVSWTIATLLRPSPEDPRGESGVVRAGGAGNTADTGVVRSPRKEVSDPAEASRRPVLLVPGWLDTEQDMATLRSRLVEAGWAPDRVRAVTFDDPAGSNRDHAVELDVVARSLLRETGIDTMDVVAFSMGGLATRWYLLHGDPVPVRRVVFLATPHHGTLTAHLAWGDGREEMMPGSAFLDTLNQAAAVPSGVQALTVRTSIDANVLPGESATLAGVADAEVCCPTHSGMLEDEQVFGIVRRFLEGGRSGG